MVYVYQQRPKGGGTRNPSIAKDSTKEDILNLEKEIKLWCFRPLLCTLFRLNWAIKPGKGKMK